MTVNGIMNTINGFYLTRKKKIFYPAYGQKTIIKQDGEGSFVDKAAWLMQVPGGGEEPEIWKKYRDIIEKHERKGTELLADMPKPEFMEETRKAYLIIASGESALYANIMLQKGCV